MITCGIDAGSRTVKAVLYDSDSGEVLSRAIADQGVKQKQIAEQLRDELSEGRCVDRLIATGYGRNALGFADDMITEITCHAMGVHHGSHEVRTIVDIGGQDSKVIWLDEGGRVHDFVMNERCAAGTGRFLEVVAQRLETGLTDLGEVAKQAVAPATISSMCVVFAETEIVGLLSSGESPENIVAGVQSSIARRIASMAGRRVAEPVIFTGGVALVSGMEKELSEALGKQVTVADSPQYTGALGAAVLAAKQ